MEVGYLVLLFLVVVAVFTDMTQTRISNRLIVAGLLLGLILRIIGEGWIGILVFIVNISIPVVLLYPLFCLRALGAGDIKLFSVVGAFLTMQQLFEVLWLSFVAAALLGILKIVCGRCRYGFRQGKLTQIHFSPAIGIAYLISIWRCING